MTPGHDLVLDDHLLLSVLLGHEPSELRPDGARLSTTGLWYHRLCRAVADPTVAGVMSRALGDVDVRVAADVTATIVELPENIGLLSLRSLGWSMGQLVAGGSRLNLLALEALAAAEHLDATICLAEADDNPPLRDAASRRGVPIRLIPTGA